MTESLLTIEQELTALADEMAAFVERGEEVPDALRARVREYVQREELKVTAIGNVLMRLKREAKTCADEANELTMRSKRKLASMDRLKKFVAQVMQAHGIDKMESATVTLTRLAGRESIECPDPSVIALRWRRLIPESFEPDKKRVADALDAGEPLPSGFVVKQGEPTLRVYR